MKISIVVAVSENNVIGNQNKIPWRISEDLKRFKKITTGHHIIMGRKTFESIGKALPNRKNIVVTRNKKILSKEVEVVYSLKEALITAKNAGENEAMIIGGAQIYKQALPIADRIYLTKVKMKIDGDTYFPKLNNQWKEISCEKHSKYNFCILEKND